MSTLITKSSWKISSDMGAKFNIFDVISFFDLLLTFHGASCVTRLTDRMRFFTTIGKWTNLTPTGTNCRSFLPFLFFKKNVLILFAQRAINIRFLYGCERVYGWWKDNFSRWLDLSLTQSERLWTVYGALVLLFVCHLQLLDTCLVYESYGTDHAVTNGGSLLTN